MLDGDHVGPPEERDADGARSIRRQCGPRGRVIRSTANHMCQMPVIGAPQCYEIAPGHKIVALTRHPLVLDVSIETHSLRRLADDESAVVVARGVDEVPEHLTSAPAARSRTPGRARFVHLL